MSSERGSLPRGGVAASIRWPGWLRARSGARLEIAEEAAIIRASGLFDAYWYVERNADGAAFSDPIVHYLRRGAARGAAPHPLFLVGWYAKQNRDLASSSLSALAHFVLHGEARGARVHPLFDPEWYRRQDVALAGMSRGLFRHFLEVGAAQGLSPHPAFDVTWYDRIRPDVGPRGMNRLTHFVQVGAAERVSPNPFFDAEFYLDAHDERDEAGENPLVHFLLKGAEEGRRPHPDVNLPAWQAARPDCPGDPVGAYIHLVTHASAETFFLPGNPWIADDQIQQIRRKTAPRRRKAEPNSRGGVGADSPATRRSEADEKARFAVLARAELLGFLAAGESLAFPAMERPDISVIVVLWNQAHLTLRCLRALHAEHGASMEIVLVDNASTDETAALLERMAGVRVLRVAANDGFLLGCNRGAAAARGRALLLLNSDAFVRPGALAAALAALDSAADIGAIGGRLILPSGRLQEAGSIVWSDGSSAGYGRGLGPEAGEAMFRRDVDYCSGAFLLTPQALWERMGGFDEALAPAYYEDTDYCMRLRAAGYRVVYEPAAAIDHYEFGSEGKRGEMLHFSLRNRKLFRARHATALRSIHLPPAEGNILAARACRARTRRHLLVIDNEVPLRAYGSGYPRAGDILAAAVAAGWSVTFFPLHRIEVDWEEARAELAEEIEIVSNGGVPRLADFLRERQGHYDAVIVSRPDNMSIVREALRERPSILHGTRLIYDAEAVFANREITKAAVEGHACSEAQANDLIASELALAEGADAVLCVTAVEAATFREHQKAPVYLLGYSADPAAGTPEWGARSGFLFVGRLLEKEAPNWLGLAWFLRECWPAIRAQLPEAKLSVVGKLHAEHEELEAPGVRLLGAIADLRPRYDAARVFLSPVRFAAGEPTKILDATAAGLPSVGLA